MDDPTDEPERVLAGATMSEHEGVRYLHLGTPWVQGAMRLRTPARIELEYVQRLMAWLLWRPSDGLARGHAVQLGLGAATVTRFCHQQLRFDRTTAVELNSTVVGACRLWFRLPPDDERLTVVLDDAARWVEERAHDAVADVLVVDLYDHEAAAPVLDDAGFYARCREVLRPGGLLAVNLFGRDASFARSAERIAAAFGAAFTWSLRPTREGNTIVVASRGVPLPDAATLRRRAATIEARHGLPALRWLRMIRPYAAPGPAPAPAHPLPDASR